MKEKLIVFGYSVLLAICLFLFSMIDDFIKYIFSLGAVLLGIKFFGSFESWKTRAWMISIAVVLYLVITVIYSMLAFVYGWPMMEA